MDSSSQGGSLAAVLAEAGDQLGGGEDGDAAEGAEGAQRPVAGDDGIYPACVSGLQDALSGSSATTASLVSG